MLRASILEYKAPSKRTYLIYFNEKGDDISLMKITDFGDQNGNGLLRLNNEADLDKLIVELQLIRKTIEENK